jgi:hypothetical protein
LPYKPRVKQIAATHRNQIPIDRLPLIEQRILKSHKSLRIKGLLPIAGELTDNL